jgi:putative MATE family efflux protein
VTDEGRRGDTAARGGIDREVLKLAVPALGALVAEPLYVLADTAIVGHLGTPQLGGVGVATTVILSGYAMFIFLAYGTTGTVARLLGAGHPERAAAQGVQALWLALGVGGALAVLGLAFGGPLVSALGATGRTAAYARTYLHISMAGVPSLTLVLAGTGYLRGLQDTRTPLYVAVASSVGNLVLELVLVYGFDLGVPASAWATVVAQTCAALAYLVVIGRHVRLLGVPVRPDRRALAGLSRVSADLFLRTMALRATILGVTAVATRLGTVSVAAHEVAFQVWSFTALVLDSLAIAAQALVAQRLGAGDAAGARAAGRRVLEWSAGCGVVFGAVLLAVRTLLPHLFTADPEVLHLAGFLLLFVALLQPAAGVVFALDGVLIGAGDLRYLAWAMAAVAVVFLPCLFLVDSMGWLWACWSALQLGRLAALTARWRTDKWARLGI